ncbi:MULTISPECIES: hypothetical protein [Protofrankia]|uniref:Uncharacterized protein n=1 Tax=Candidatus Protofrankia datiscae TaxID=2716812 RepID=F8AXN4_9ACTN|nr:MULTISPECIES: hypothetical protein [Protofrankia]AEH10390.1 hypothetical protein FsymDg_3078 [Candidatus Protofrankia datiscae]
MMRVSPETRERVLRVAAEDFGGASADETVRRLLDEHWQRKAVAAMDRFRAQDPGGWAEYLAEGRAWSAVDAPVADEAWDADEVWDESV